eukprot:65691-Pelagomonas_calceolata.AAC.1
MVSNEAGRVPSFSNVELILALLAFKLDSCICKRVSVCERSHCFESNKCVHKGGFYHLCPWPGAVDE